MLLAATVCTGAGCDLFGGGLSPLPFGKITAVQLFDEPNGTAPSPRSAGSVLVRPST